MNIIILGATSAIAQAVCRQLSARKTNFYLVARDSEKLSAVAADLQTRGAKVSGLAAVDLNDAATHPQLFDAAAAAMGGIDSVFIAHGVLGDQKTAEKSWDATAALLQVNFISAASLMTLAANFFERQGSGQIVIIGSVAGDRGRKTNYIYGAAKGATERFAQGLAHRFGNTGINVLLVKPGFVATPMTAHLPASPLTAAPEAVAASIVKAMDARTSVIYTPFFWRYIMLIIRLMPEKIFNKMNF